MNDLVVSLAFDVPAELVAHGRQNLAGEVAFSAGTEALVESGAQHRGGYPLVDGREDGPAALARIGNAAGKAVEARTFLEGRRRQTAQPRSHHPAPRPHFSGVRRIRVA